MPLVTVIFVIVGYFLSQKPTEKIPILINGLIPSEPGAQSKDESGTTVYIVYIDKETDKKGEEIFRGYADEDGRVEAYIPSDNVGRFVLIRARNAAYKSEELRRTIPRYGIIHTMKNEMERGYTSSPRGKNVGDLAAYYSAALTSAEIDRERYIQNAANIASHPFARIPVYFWLVVYIISILAFAGDYYHLADSFHKNCESLESFESFIHSIYFSTVTITTLGYGDTYPITDDLRIAVSLEAILGIFVVGFALNSLFYRPSR